MSSTYQVLRRGHTPGSASTRQRQESDRKQHGLSLSGDPLAIKFSVSRTGLKCLEHQVKEAVQLANIEPDKIINTQMEFMAPALERMMHTKFLDDGARVKTN